MNIDKVKEIESLFRTNDAKLVNAFNEGTELHGMGIERQLYFLQTRLLLTSSVLSQLLSAITEEHHNGKI